MPSPDLKQLSLEFACLEQMRTSAGEARAALATPYTSKFAVSRAGGTRSGAWLLLAGISLASCMDAINSTALTVSRGDMMGGIRAVPDEMAWVSLAYLAAKLTSFPLGAWLISRLGYGRCLISATVLLLAASLTNGLTTQFVPILLARAVQGAAGAALIVAGQSLLFEIFPRSKQGVVQAVFALGAVMVPNTFAPALQGWLTDTLSWSWMFLANLPIGLLALAFIVAGVDAEARAATAKPLDAIGLALLAPGMVCLAFVLQEGNRWNWFEAPHIAYLTAAGAFALAGFVLRQLRMQGRNALIDFSVFAEADFTFGFVVSFVAGFGLFGSAMLIPAFALAVLHFPALQAGLLLLPSGALIALGLLGAGGLIQSRRIVPFKLVPLGILLFVSAMWLLSGAAIDSGFSDLAAPLLIRGFGLGALFIALTVMTLNGLDGRGIAHGVGLFNLGRQIGGLLGVAFVQTYLAHRVAYHWNVLVANVAPENPLWTETQSGIARLLLANGQEPHQAMAAAAGMAQQFIGAQAAVLAFNEAFLALAVAFVLLAPLLIALKLALKRSAAGNGARRVDAGTSVPANS